MVTLEYTPAIARCANALSSVRQVMNLIENKRAPKRATRFLVANAGSPQSGDTHGDRTLIVIAKGQRRLHGNEGATLEGGSEHPQDTGMQGR